MKPHPIASKFPMLPPAELMELAGRIKKNGQRRVGWTYGTDEKGNPLLLDGRNRQEACRIAGVEFRTKEFKGTLQEAIDFVIDENIGRRHLTPGERAAIGAELATLAKGAHASNEAPSQTTVAEKLGVSRSTVQRAAKKAKAPKEPKTEKTSWTADELKADDNELGDLFTAISAVYGNDDTRAIRTGIIGLNKADVAFLAKLPKDKMLEVHDLVMANRWKPKKAFEHLNTMATEDSTVEDLINYCLGTKGKFWSADFMNGGYTVTVKGNRAAGR